MLKQIKQTVHGLNAVWNNAGRDRLTYSTPRMVTLLKYIIFILMTMDIIISVGYYLLQPVNTHNRLLNLCASLGLLIPLLLALYLNRGRHFLTAARITIGSIVLGIFSISLISIEQNGLQMLFYLIFPLMLATFFLPFMEAFWISIVSLGAILLLRILLPDQDFISVPFATTLSVSLIFLLTAYHIRNEEREHQQALMESELRYRSLVENSPEAILVYSQSSSMIADANLKAIQLFGYDYEDLLSSSILDLFPPDLVKDPLYRQSINSIFNKDITNDTPPSEYTMAHKDGTLLPCEIRVAPFPSLDDPLVRASIMDLSNRKEMEDALFRAHLHTQGLIEAIHSLVIEIEYNRSVIFWNARAQNVFGISAGQALNQDIHKLPISWNWEPIKHALDQCISRNKTTTLHNVKFMRPDQSPGFLDLTLIPVKNGKNDLPDIIITGNDITKQKLMYDQLYQSEKLRALGELAAGIAHEINSPMQYISNNLTFLKEEFDRLLRPLTSYGSNGSHSPNTTKGDPAELDFNEWKKTVDLDFLLEEIPLAFEQSSDGVRTITSIVQALREFSYPGSKEKTPTDINKAVLNTLTIARNEWKYSCEVCTELDERLPLVPCYPAEFNQAILNLVTNAVDAIEAEIERERYLKGTITIKTMRKEDWAVLQFEDNGCGIPEVNLSRIFEPFFTTKEIGKGTGQGLAITHNIIAKKLQGTIQVFSEPDIGTRFLIRLPLNTSETDQIEDQIPVHLGPP